MIADLIGPALLNMILGMSFVLIFLGLLVGYMHLLARDWRKPGLNDDNNGESREREAEQGTLALRARLEYETGAGMEPGEAAAISMALFQLLDERRRALPEARTGPAAGAWAQEGRERMMSQRAMWWWRR